MSFRREKERPRRWQQRRARLRDELVATGMPEWVYADESRWAHFLQEGGLDWDTGWCVEMLPRLNAERLRALVVREYGPDQHRCCLRSLERAI